VKKLTTIIAALVIACVAGCNGGAGAGSRLTSAQVEEMARDYYAKLAAFDLPGIAATTTPEFEAIEHSGEFSVRFNKAEWEARLKEIQQSGMALKIDVSDFNTRVTADSAHTTYIETFSGTDRKFIAGLIIVRSGDKWLIDRFFTMPMIPRTAAPAGTEAPAPPAAPPST
jgi:hypothetical protein